MERTLSILACALLACMISATGLQALPPTTRLEPPADRYVPVGIWRDDAQEILFESWFGRQLRAMNEPILSRLTDREGFKRRFRMLVLPTFHPAYAIRIDERSSDGRVRAVRLDGHGGYDPGGIAQQEQYSLDRNEMREVGQAIDRSGLALLSPNPEPDGPICLDGAQFVFELVDEVESRFVTRHECELSPELRRLVEEIDGLRRRVGSDLHHYGF